MKTEFALKFFKPRRAADPAPPASYAYDDRFVQWCHVVANVAEA